MREREVVPGLADLDDVALLQVVVHSARSATRIRNAQHADQITMRLARIVAQRILAHDTVPDVYVDVRTGTEIRQRVAERIGELEGADIGRLDRLPDDLHAVSCTSSGWSELAPQIAA